MCQLITFFQPSLLSGTIVDELRNFQVIVEGYPRFGF